MLRGRCCGAAPHLRDPSAPLRVPPHPARREGSGTERGGTKRGRRAAPRRHGELRALRVSAGHGVRAEVSRGRDAASRDGAGCSVQTWSCWRITTAIPGVERPRRGTGWESWGCLT